MRKANSSMSTCVDTCYIVVFTRLLIRKCRKSVSLQSVNTTTFPLSSPNARTFPWLDGPDVSTTTTTILLAGRVVTLAMLSARKLWVSGGIGIPDESRKTKMETTNRAGLLSRSTVAWRRCLIKNVTSWELVHKTSFFGRMSFYNLNFLFEKVRKEETFFHPVKAPRKQLI